MPYPSYKASSTLRPQTSLLEARASAPASRACFADPPALSAASQKAEAVVSTQGKSSSSVKAKNEPKGWAASTSSIIVGTFCRPHTPLTIQSKDTGLAACTSISSAWGSEVLVICQGTFFPQIW